MHIIAHLNYKNNKNGHKTVKNRNYNKNIDKQMCIFNKNKRETEKILEKINKKNYYYRINKKKQSKRGLEREERNRNDLHCND